MADDNLSATPKSDQNFIIRNSRILIKTVEIMLAVLIIGLMVDPLTHYQKIAINQHKKIADIAIIYIAVAGYLIINVLFFVAHIIGDKIPKRTFIMFSTVGFILHVVAAAVMFHNWRTLTNPYTGSYYSAIRPSQMYNHMLISASVFTLIDAIIYGLDIFVAIKYT